MIHTVTLVAVVIRALTIASQSSTYMAHKWHILWQLAAILNVAVRQN